MTFRCSSLVIGYLSVRLRTIACHNGGVMRLHFLSANSTSSNSPVGIPSDRELLLPRRSLGSAGLQRAVQLDQQKERAFAILLYHLD